MDLFLSTKGQSLLPWFCRNVDHGSVNVGHGSPANGGHGPVNVGHGSPVNGGHGPVNVGRGSVGVDHCI